MSKYLTVEQIGPHIRKMQGSASDTAFAASLGITRQTMRLIRNGLIIPNTITRAKIGLRLKYEVVPPSNPDAKPAEAVASTPAVKKPKK